MDLNSDRCACGRDAHGSDVHADRSALAKTVATAPVLVAVAHAPAVPAVLMLLHLLGHCRAFAWQRCSIRCCKAEAQSKGAGQNTSNDRTTHLPAPFLVCSGKSVPSTMNTGWRWCKGRKSTYRALGIYRRQGTGPELTWASNVSDAGWLGAPSTLSLSN